MSSIPFFKALEKIKHHLHLRTDTVRCVLCAIAKNEAEYVHEWAAFHIAIGFDEIVIYDNESMDCLANAFQSGCWPVKVVPWPTSACQSPQAAAYNHFVKSRRGSRDWIAFLDLDEFLNLKKHESLKSFLADYRGIDAIGINWRMFGSSLHSSASTGFVIDRFQRAASNNFEINQHIKTIARLDQIIEVGVHSPSLRSGARFISPDCKPRVEGCNAWQTHVDHSIAQVNHYFTKSREEFEKKRLRGRADLPPEALDRLRSREEFALYDRNEHSDTSILRWRPATMQVLQKMLQFPKTI
ncbi:glycosyltransferase family 2 protein [Beijerinckia sp. L45]|uniref:glycosyltransferase family 2 protein n=1 Tax=Beijerinckia sp. L45 TaxID=1641855 RepID=UPI00131BB7CD|nr:glycosyltransferase family 2 protein [Beijerinckia sp. L45]